MIYCWKCPICGRREETRGTGYKNAPKCDHGETDDVANPVVEMIRDYRSEMVQVDRFSLRQDVYGTRAHRADPLPPDEAHKVNQERKAR